MQLKKYFMTYINLHKICINYNNLLNIIKNLPLLGGVYKNKIHSL